MKSHHTRYMLLVESSLGGCGVGLAEATYPSSKACSLEAAWQMVATSVEGGKYKASSSLAPLAKQLLQQHAVSLQEVSHFVVSYGPGSCTGIKVGIAFVQGIYMGLQMLAKAHDLWTPKWLGVSGLCMVRDFFVKSPKTKEKSLVLDALDKAVVVIYKQNARSGFVVTNMTEAKNTHKENKEGKDKDKDKEWGIHAFSSRNEEWCKERIGQWLKAYKRVVVYIVGDEDVSAVLPSSVLSLAECNKLSYALSIEASLQSMLEYVNMGEATWLITPPEARYFGSHYADRMKG